MKTVTLLCVGIGGYGGVLLNELLKNEARQGIRIAAAVEPYPASCPLAGELEARGTAIYPDMESYYAHTAQTGEAPADIAVIATPIACHTHHILTALAGGSNVVCEKPLCADERDIDTLIRARDASGKFVHIGYQWSHAEAIETLKNDVLAGLFGAPKRLKTLVLWSRGTDYFRRGTGWAGKIRNADGTPVYDSIANNAAAHYLHNMFYLLGDRIDRALAPADFDAVLNRANPIENFDTAQINLRFDNGAEAHFIASHATDKNLNPLFDYRFEKGRILYSEDAVPVTVPDAALYEKGCIKAIFADGSVKRYGNPFDGVCRKIYLAAARVRGDANGYERCGIETAAVHTRFINRLQAVGTIKDFPAERIITTASGVCVEGLFDELVARYSAL